MADFFPYYPEEKELPLMENTQRTYMGYQAKLRGVIDRFDAIISEASLSSSGLEKEKSLKRWAKQKNIYFAISTGVLWVLLAVFWIICIKSVKGNENFTRLFIALALASTVPMIVFTVWIVLRLIKSIKIYGAFMSLPKHNEYKNKWGIKSYYEKMDRYAKIITVLNKRKKVYVEILEKIEFGQDLSEGDIWYVENMSDDIYRIPELGFTFHKI